MSYNNNMQTFSVERFVDELKRVGLQRPGLTAMQAIIVFGAIFLITMFIENSNLSANLADWKNNPDIQNYFYDSRTLTTELYVMVFLFPVFSAISASLMFNGLRNKQSKISYLIEPVTVIEKYLAQAIVYVVAFGVVFILSCIIADLLRPMVFGVLTIGQKTHFTTMLPLFIDDFGRMVRVIFLSWSSGMLAASVYGLGSVVWPRNSFVKVSAALIVLAAAIGIWIAFLITMTSEPNFSPFDKWVTTNTFSVAMLIFAVFNWLVCIVRLKETDLK